MEMLRCYCMMCVSPKPGVNAVPCLPPQDYELQLMTYKAFVESQQKSPGKRRRMLSSSDAITQEVKGGCGQGCVHCPQGRIRSSGPYDLTAVECVTS